MCRGPSAARPGTPLAPDESAGGRGRARRLHAAQPRPPPGCRSGGQVRAGCRRPARRSPAPRPPTGLSAPRAAAALSRGSALPAWSCPDGAGHRRPPTPPRGAQRLIPRSGSRPPSPFPLWPSPASGRPRGLPRPRAARARRSPGGPAPSRPPRLRGLKGGRPDSARRSPRAREGGGRPSGAARSPRSGGAAAGARRGPVRRGARARPAPVSPGRSPRRLGRQERRPGPAPGDGGARAGRSGPGSPRPLSRARGQPEEGCAERRGPVPSPQKRPCAGPVIANHQSPLITADEAGGGGAFPGAGRAGGERGALPRRSGR